MKRVSLVLAFLLTLSLACSLTSLSEGTGEDGAPSTPSPQSEKRCGDGVCDGPENPQNCPADCTAPTGEAQPSATATGPEPPSGEPQEEIPPLYFFYVIHTHAQGDWLPYEGPPLLDLNPTTADNMLLAITGIQEVLDRYGVKGTWEVVFGTAKGLCSYQGPNHIFRQLEDAGHEVAVHAHRTEDIDDAYQNLVNDCGIIPVTTSGFIPEVERAGPAGAQQAMIDAIQTSLALGLTVGTENLSPGGGKNPFAELCDNQLGVANDMWEQTGNLMFPWRPDYINGNICADNPAGQMVLVDHVSIEWKLLPGEGVPQALSDEHFERLRLMFDAALEYMETRRPDRVAAWGFVTHITEYGSGGKAQHPPDPASLAALDRFLAYVAEKAAAGRVVFATASEIAEAAYPGVVP